MSFGKESSSSKPVWAAAQKGAFDDVFKQLLFPIAFGGAPDPGTEQQVARGREGLTEQLAGQGLTGTGLAAKAASNFEVGAQQKREAGKLSVIDRILAPLGQAQSGTGPLHLGS